MAISSEEVRIECLKLAVALTSSAQDTIRLAAGFEAWVGGGDRDAVNAAMDAIGPSREASRGR